MDCNSKIGQVDGSPLNVYGWAWLDLQVRTVHQAKALFADISVPAILGMDWRLATKGSLDFQRLELKVSGERIRCTGSTGKIHLLDEW